MEKIKCNLCDSDNYKIILEVKDYRCQTTDEVFNLVMCKNCGLIYLNPMPAVEDLKNYYPEEYYDVNSCYLLKFVNNFFGSLKIRNVLKYKNKGRLLDIGCGGGDFICRMKNEGFDIYGIDTSRKACNITKEKLGVENSQRIFNGELEACNFPDNYFDVITLWHVLEHLYEPKKTLEEIHRILKKDGIVIIEVPNIESLIFKVFKKYFFHLEIPRHLYFYSKKTVKKMLNKTRFEGNKIGYSSSAFLFSSFHSFCNLMNTYKIKLPLYQILFIISLPLLIVLTILSRIIPFRGDVLLAYARKK